MNFLEKIIIKRAEKIKEKNIMVEYTTMQSKLEKEKIRTTRIKNIREVIRKKLDEVEKEMLKESLPLKAGDTAIINRYYLNYKSEGCWDWGPRQMEINIDKEEYLTPCKVEITKLAIHDTFADDLIHRFIEKLEDKGRLPYYGDNPESAINAYEFFVKSIKKSWFNEYGLYKEFYFKPINFSFTPSWGLNIDSFLKIDSEAGKLTEKLWKEESRIKLARRKLTSDETNFEGTKTKLIREYEDKYL